MPFIPPASSSSTINAQSLFSRIENVRLVDISNFSPTEGTFLHVFDDTGSLTDNSVLNPFDDKLKKITNRAKEGDFNIPTQGVLETTKIIYGLLDEKSIKYVDSPLAEGGVGFEFNHKGAYYNIKVDNDLDAAFYIEDKNKLPHGWDLTFDELINKIKIDL